MDMKKEIEYRTGYRNVSPLGDLYEALLPRGVDMTNIRDLYGAISDEGKFVILGYYFVSYSAFSSYWAVQELRVYGYDSEGNELSYYVGGMDVEITYDWRRLFSSES